jgi:DUF4097 and DUF4098 domain-containing protein YvlB
MIVISMETLHAGEITRTEFLEMAATLKGHISQRLTNISDEYSENEMEVEEIPVNVTFGKQNNYNVIQSTNQKITCIHLKN